MIINTKSHPNKEVYKKQFTELLDVNKLSYGIVSDTNPKNESSPLWCSIKDGTIYILKGTAVLKDGTVIRLTDNSTIFINYPYENNKILYIIIRANYVVESKGVNEFNEEKDKSINVSDALIEVVENFDENTSICLGVIRAYKTNSTIIQNNDENIDVRPWYSPKDVKHRLVLGSGKVTDKNPHGISYNDIDPNNTLHNKLLSRGILLSKPVSTQDVCGTYKECFISKDEVKFDSDNSLFGEYISLKSDNYTTKINYAYFVLPDIPINVISIEDTNKNHLKEYSWIEHTSLIKVDVSKTKIKDFVIKYYYESSLEPYISNEGNGVSVKDIRKNCVVFSEGKSLTEIDKEIAFNELENTPNNYSIYLKASGNYVKVPSLEASNDLDNAEGELTKLFSKSRLEFIIDDLSKDVLKCPISVKGEGTCSKSTEIYQSFGLYVKDLDGNRILKNESKICPEPFIPCIVNGENKVLIQYEKSSQKNIECQKLDKVNFTINENENYNIQFNSRNNSCIYGGVDIDFEFLSTEETDRYINIRIGHLDKELEINVNSKSSSLSIHSDYFDEKNCYGEWNITIVSPKKLYVTNFAINVNFGKVEPIFYSKIDDVYTRLKIIKQDNDVCEVNPFYGSVVSVKDNSDFNVSINVVGTSNGENINETIEFNYKYRNQDYLNSKLSNNVFDEVFKYSVTDSTTKGKISIFAYPVGNVNNMCEVLSCSYRNNKISKLYDSRKVCPNILYENKNILGKAFDFVNSITTFIAKSLRKNYFELKNRNNFTITITLYSVDSFYADVITNDETINFVSCVEYNDYYKITLELSQNSSVRTYKQRAGNLNCIVEVEDSAKVEIVHWDNSWTTLENLCFSMKSLVKIPNSWEGCNNVTSIKNAFMDSKIESIPRTWNGLSKVINMDDAFKNCEINYMPNSWKGLDKVSSMRSCFENCTNLKISELNFIGLNLKENGVENTFNNTTIEKIASFEGLDDVTSLKNTFSNSKLSEIPMNWSFLEEVVNTESAFENCKLKSIPKSWYGLNKVKNAKAMFKNCTMLEYIPISWLGLDSVESIEELFYDCSSVKDGGYEDVDSLVNIKYFDNAFYGMTSWKVDADAIYEMLRNIAGDDNV